jgi:benzoyl-CoA-dihydrodiol lyase
VKFDRAQRLVEVTLEVPDSGAPKDASEAFEQGPRWWALRAFRELDEAIVDLRFNEPDIGLVLLRVKGSVATLAATDDLLAASQHWFVKEVRHLVKRVLKRIDNTAKSLYAIADGGTSFVGTGLELALACDRIYLLNDPDQPVTLGTSPANKGLFPMANGLSRLQTRFLGTPERVAQVLGAGSPIDPDSAVELGLATFAPDAIDWEDELRLALEERVSFSPDSMTGMEANLRFAGPETMETKIFGRLSAWQNWIFQRPNAVGERGALTCYGTPNRPEFDVQRT